MKLLPSKLSLMVLETEQHHSEFQLKRRQPTVKATLKIEDQLQTSMHILSVQSSFQPLASKEKVLKKWLNTMKNGFNSSKLKELLFPEHDYQIKNKIYLQ